MHKDQEILLLVLWSTFMCAFRFLWSNNEKFTEEYMNIFDWNYCIFLLVFSDLEKKVGLFFCDKSNKCTRTAVIFRFDWMKNDVKIQLLMFWSTFMCEFKFFLWNNEKLTGKYMDFSDWNYCLFLSSLYDLQNNRLLSFRSTRKYIHNKRRFVLLLFCINGSKESLHHVFIPSWMCISFFSFKQTF